MRTFPFLFGQLGFPSRLGISAARSSLSSALQFFASALFSLFTQPHFLFKPWVSPNFCLHIVNLWMLIFLTGEHAKSATEIRDMSVGKKYQTAWSRELKRYILSNAMLWLLLPPVLHHLAPLPTLVLHLDQSRLLTLLNFWCGGGRGHCLAASW